MIVHAKTSTTHDRLTRRGTSVTELASQAKPPPSTIPPTAAAGIRRSVSQDTETEPGIDKDPLGWARDRFWAIKGRPRGAMDPAASQTVLARIDVEPSQTRTRA